MFTRRTARDDQLTRARRRVDRLTAPAAREWGIAVAGYVMRILENPTPEHPQDDLAELDTALAALQAIRERLSNPA